MIKNLVLLTLIIVQIKPVACQIDLDSLDIERNIETVLLRFANSEGTIPNLNDIAQNSNFELHQLTTAIDSLKKRGYYKNSEKIIFNQIARNALDSLTKGKTVMVGNTFSNSTFTSNKHNDHSTFIFNGNTVDNKSDVQVSIENDMNISDNKFTDTTKAHINDVTRINPKREMVNQNTIDPKNSNNNRKILNKSKKKIESPSESTLMKIWNDSVWSKVIALLIATMIITTFTFLYNKFISAIRFRGKSYYDKKYILNNTRKGGPADYKKWLIGYKSNGGKVFSMKRSKKENFDKLRIIDKHIFLNPFYGNNSFDFIVTKKGKVTYLKDSIGHNTLYQMDDFTSTNSNPLNM